MQLLFLDESGQLAQRRFFALGGVALRDGDWYRLCDLWQETLASYGWPVEREVKWHGIRTGEVPPALADAIVGALAGSPVRCYVTLLDVALGVTDAPELFGSDEDTYATGLMFLAERAKRPGCSEPAAGRVRRLPKRPRAASAPRSG